MTDRTRIHSQQSHRHNESSVALWACIGYLIVCLALGGGTRQALVADDLLQLLALPILAWAITRLPWSAQPQAAKWAIVWAGGVVAWMALQLIPLPPALWRELVGRETLAVELALAGVDDQWRPISLDWQASVRALFAWLPPLAVGVMALGLTSRQRVSMLRCLLLAAVVASILGLAQLSVGPESALRWHEITNRHAAVGPFANRNHLATFLACLLSLGIAAFTSANDGSRDRRPLRLTLAVLACVVILIGLAMTRSRAGVAMGCLSIVGAVVMGWVWRRSRHRMDVTSDSLRGWILLGVLLIGFLIVQYALVGLLRSFDKDALDDSRWTIAATTLSMIAETGKLGTGGGTFPVIFDSFEPLDERSGTYVNRAHNDWLEWWLEGGFPILFLMAAGLILLAHASWQVFRNQRSDAVWYQAAAVGIGVILIHSVLDYPLRTTAMSVTMATLVACVIKGAQRRQGQREERRLAAADIGRISQRRKRSS